MQAAAEKVAASCWRVADVDFLVEMLTMPTLRIEAQRVFERAIARGAFGEQSVVMVLERRRSQRLILGTRMSASSATAPASHVQDPLMPGTPGGGIDYLHPLEEDDDFPAVLQLAEALALSRDLRVREFVSTMYAVMFKVYGDEGYHERMLRGLVERATSSTSGPHEVELGMDILTFLVREEEGTARPVLSMMRKVAEAANAERNVLWQQLRSRDDDILRSRNERQAELGRVSREKAVLSQRLADADIAQGRLKVFHNSKLLVAEAVVLDKLLNIFYLARRTCALYYDDTHSSMMANVGFRFFRFLFIIFRIWNEYYFMLFKISFSPSLCSYFCLRLNFD